MRLLELTSSLTMENYTYMLLIFAASTSIGIVLGKPVRIQAAKKTTCAFRPTGRNDFLTATLELVRQLGRKNVLPRQLQNIQDVTPFPIIRYACEVCPSFALSEMCRTPPDIGRGREHIQVPASNDSAAVRSYKQFSLANAMAKTYSFSKGRRNLNLRKSCAWAYLRPECIFNPTIFPPIICQPKCNSSKFTCSCGKKCSKKCSVSNPLYWREVTFLEMTGCNRTGHVQWIARSRSLLPLQYGVCGCRATSKHS